MERKLINSQVMPDADKYTLEIIGAVIGLMCYFLFTDGSGFFMIHIDWIAYIFSAIEVGFVTFFSGFLTFLGKKFGEKWYKKHFEKGTKGMNQGREPTDL